LRKDNRSSLGIVLVLVLLIAGVVYLYNSSMFERNAPIIKLEQNGYWNLKKPLKLTISDESGIKEYKVILKSKKESMELNYDRPLMAPKELILELNPPRSAYAIKEKKLSIVVEAVDKSKWDFFNGNRVVKKYDLIIDKRRPEVSVVSNSYKISRGGSALVIFRAVDDNLQNLFIESTDGKKFLAEPFYKEGYYIALLAWPVTQSSFRATVMAEDSAGNIAKEYIPLYLKNRDYRLSKITLTDKFLNGKIMDLAELYQETQGVDGILNQFKIINEDVRAKNETLIHKITSVVPSEMISDFKIHRMYPLKDAAVVAHFGDHRKYFYKGQFISEAYHLGLDLASYKNAKIISQNGGKVVFADYNGLYGNSPIISHGLGLYTLYGHCSHLDVTKGDRVSKNQKFANTGKTGYAMGDHLHFGVLVQGIEVRPQEWMDSHWIKLNITNIIKSAKKIIDRD